jgi:hypothetical protein
MSRGKRGSLTELAEIKRAHPPPIPPSREGRKKGTGRERVRNMREREIT